MGGVGERHASCPADEQRHAKECFEFFHRSTHRAGTDAQLARGAREAAVPGGGLEDSHPQQWRNTHVDHFKIFSA